MYKITVSLTSILILSFHLHLGLPRGHFPADLSVKILIVILPYSFLPTRPAYLILLDLITLTTRFSDEFLIHEGLRQ